MKRDPAFTLLVLDQIALPLITAVMRSATPRDEQTARISIMLDQAVGFTKTLEGLMDASPSQTHRLGLAALASKLVAAQMETEGEQSDNDAERITKLLGKITPYSNTYEPSEQSIAYLKALSSPLELHDSAQAGIKYLLAFAPILGAITEFSYGMPEGKLIQDVANTLSVKASALREKLLGTKDLAGHFGNAFLGDDEDKIYDLAILTALAALYGETHRAETRNIMKMSESLRMAQGSQLTIDIVWRAFDKKIAMLEALIEGLIPAKKEPPPAIPPEPPDLSTDIDIEQILETPQEKKDSPLSFYTRKKN